MGLAVRAVLRGLRVEREWTQKDLARISGLSASYVAQMETGQYAPTLTTMVQLAGAFGITLCQLVGLFEKAAAPAKVNVTNVTTQPKAGLSYRAVP